MEFEILSLVEETSLGWMRVVLATFEEEIVEVYVWLTSGLPGGVPCVGRGLRSYFFRNGPDLERHFGSRIPSMCEQEYP